MMEAKLHFLAVVIMTELQQIQASPVEGMGVQYEKMAKVPLLPLVVSS